MKFLIILNQTVKCVQDNTISILGLSGDNNYMISTNSLYVIFWDIKNILGRKW